jgi:RNA polymerase sigma-70 factor (ECF subfamily)
MVGEEATALAWHLAECAKCQAVAEGPLPPDPLLSALAGKPEPSEEPDDSLLERLRQRPCDQTAWKEFVDLYAPLVRACVQKRGFSGQDRENLVAECMKMIFVELPEFVYHDEDEYSFRSWLEFIVLHLCLTQRKKWPTPSLPDGVEPVVPDTVEDFIKRESLRYLLVRRTLQLTKRAFEPIIWRACKLLVKGLPARDVASRLRMTVAAVYTAKSRVLARLRQEVAGEEATAFAGHLAVCAKCQNDAESSLPPDPFLSAFNSLVAMLKQPQHPDEMGRLGDYRVLRVLGSGEMGVVFEAEDQSLHRRVALKVLHPTDRRAMMVKLFGC